ncbi:MAG: amylo-alpha-1,6-glucosidase [Nitrospirota bacterium]
MSLGFGREICGNLRSAETREWLVTNGLGGYASGTVSGVLTRRYHGTLVAALKPPLGRTLLVAKLDEAARYHDRDYPLSTNRWADGTVAPHGYRHIEHFSLEGATPVWRFACADAWLEKRVWMQQGENTTYVRYDLRRATEPLTLEVKALVNYRDYHATTRGGTWRMALDPIKDGISVTAFPGARPFYLLAEGAEALPAHAWHLGFDLPVERDRGLDHREDHLHAVTFRAELEPGTSLTIVASTESNPTLDGRAALATRQQHERDVMKHWKAARPKTKGVVPEWIDHLALAADQFIVNRPSRDKPDGRTIIAGYHWFGDWGRDTMISLPGLTLSTGRPEVARSILRTFARYVDHGMLPNRFPDEGETPEYNTVDATLWYVEAIRVYHAATGDDDLLRELFPALRDVIDWHVKGTRYRIHVNPEDGLLSAGEPGVQLTWMDAKVGDRVITPRIGKPVEVNALWYNALRAMAEFARYLGTPDKEYEVMAGRSRKGFKRFWNETAGYCYDVLDGPDGHDPSLRPNQILAVSLPESPLDVAQQRGVVEACATHLLTSYGLRSLAPGDPRYQGHYGGDQRSRDGAYHQGTVWGWLMGPFVLAHARVYKDPQRALALLDPLADHLLAHGVGSLSEIFDGDAPMTPRGCIAQAWTVAEVLRAWTAIQNYPAMRLAEIRTRRAGSKRTR